MRIHRVCLLLVLAGLAVHEAGCLAVVAGAGAAGTVAYLQGDLESEESYKLDTVYTATREAMNQLELSVLEGKTEKDALSATIVARDASDQRVTVKLKSQSEQSTKLSIRVGTFGNQTKSNMLYNRIRENLKATVPALSQPAQKATESPTSPPPSPASNLPVAHVPASQATTSQASK
jgi:hypothetical protein